MLDRYNFVFKLRQHLAHMIAAEEKNDFAGEVNISYELDDFMDIIEENPKHWKFLFDLLSKEEYRSR